MSELPPNGPEHGQWHLILAVLLHKYRNDLPRDVVVTKADIEAFKSLGDVYLIALEQQDAMHLWLADDAETESLTRAARQERGRPS